MKKENVIVMISNISWIQFAIWITVASVIYYSVIIALYYRKELLLLFKGNKGFENDDRTERINHELISSEVNDANLISEVPFTPSFENNNDYLAHIAAELIKAIDEIIDRAASRKYGESELKASVTFLLKGYSILADSSYLETISKYIIHHSEKYCSIHLDAEEVRLLWPENGEWS